MNVAVPNQRQDDDGGRPLRVIVVDDEELARVLLRELLAAYPDIEIAAECGNGF